MTNPTSNFGWQMPTSTDLVTDLPADFETFGQAVDTSLADLKGGTTGQMLTKATNTDMDFTWVTPQIGDITAVTAGTGISGGGTTGDVTITNSMATAIDAKGDLIGGTGADTFARLAVGTNGQVLTADSTASTGLAWATPSTTISNAFFAGKNKIINGDFGINQRNFTSTTAQGAYGFDRFAMDISANTCTYSAQVFTPGTAPVSGYEGTNYARFVTAAQDATTGYSILWQRIEDARVFAGQTVTFSLWAKANSGTPKIAVELVQKFGSGGSTEVQTYAGQVTLSTSWARYSVTVAVPSVSGKTIGSGSSLTLNLWLSAGTSYNSRTGSLGVQNNTLELWGLQLEAGSTATSFQTASGTVQGELALCQRYFYRAATPDQAYGVFGWGMGQDSTAAQIIVKMPQTMRILPSSIGYSTLRIADTSSGLACTAVSINANQSTRDIVHLTATVASGSTQYRPFLMGGNNSTSAYIEFNAEL